MEETPDGLTPPGPPVDPDGAGAAGEPSRTGGMSVDDWMAAQAARPQAPAAPPAPAVTNPYAGDPYAQRFGRKPDFGPSYDPDTSRKMAGWALALAIVCCIPFGFLVAIGLAIAVLVRSRTPGDHGKGRAIAALVIASLVLLLNVGYFVAALIEGFNGFDTTERDSQGRVTDGGSVSVGKLRIGDCYSEPKLADLPDDGSEGESPASVDVVPCGQTHQAEVFAIIELGGGDYPGDAGVRRRLRDCLPAFEHYVGRPYRRSELDIIFFYPTSASWRFGDRSITCSLVSRDLSDLSSSQKNARR